MKRWDNIDYQAIVNAEIDGNMLLITFANKDFVEVEIQTLLPFISESVVKDIKQDNLHFSSYELCLDIDSESKYIPWDKIRVLTDMEFSKFMSEQAVEQAKLIGVKLKRLREKKGIKSIELAERSGITAQSISRIEKGHQDISFTTLRKLLASMGYSLSDLAKEESELEFEKTDQKSFKNLLRKLARIGIDPTFLTKRILPKNLQIELGNNQSEQSDLLLNETAIYLSNIYGWNTKDIWSDSDLYINSSVLPVTFFKKGVKSNSNQIAAYLPYANYLAKAVLKSSKKRDCLPYPTEIVEFKKILNDSYGGITLVSILSFCWDMGICVVPLNDSGLFHGAAWNINGRHVIILKQKVNSHAKWIFDLLHELFHVFAHLTNINESIIESNEISPVSNEDDIKELEANSFASQIIFDGNPEVYAQEVVTSSKGKTEYLKSAVQTVALKNGIRVDALANYLAYRLAFQGGEWWSTADSLQEKEPEPYQIAKEFLIRNIDLNKLGPIEYNLLNSAVNN